MCQEPNRSYKISHAVNFHHIDSSQELTLVKKRAIDVLNMYMDVGYATIVMSEESMLQL